MTLIFIIIIVALAGIVLLLIYKLYSYSKRPRIDIRVGSRDSVDTKLSELRKGVLDLRESLKRRENAFKAFRED